MNPFGFIIKRWGTPGLIVALIVCALIVTLSVFRCLNDDSLEKLANGFIKIETGVDLEKVEEGIIQKNK